MYKKPMIIMNDDIAEGVYTASGTTGDSCYTCSAQVVQRPATGFPFCVIQVNARHQASHTKDRQYWTISFNQNVTFDSCNANGFQLTGGNGTTSLTFTTTYHQNPTDNIGFGDLRVKADAGLAVTGISCSD